MAERMQKIMLVTYLSGLRDGEHWPEPGVVFSVKESHAEELIAQGFAVPAKDAKTETAADKRPVETEVL